MNKDIIRVLDDREKSREKISVWYGSRDNYYHGLKEVIANGTDEIINNFDEGTVTVELHDDLQTITVKDTGRGIPIDGETDGVKNYDLLFRTLFAGTKYDTTEETTTGTNGVGNTVLCYTSSIFYVESCYNGYRNTLKFENGGYIAQDLKKEKCDKNLHGTSITFKLDPKVYPKTTYDVEEVESIIKRFAVSSSKVKLVFKYKDKIKEFYYETIEDYYKELVGNSSTSPIVTSPKVLYDDEGEKNSIKLVFSTTPEPIQESYLNLTYLAEGGSFNDGVIAGIRKFANKYCNDNKLFPRGVSSFSMSDVESSVSFVLVALSNKVEFQNQTKLSTNKKLYKKIAQKHAAQLLEILKVEDEPGLKKLINHLLTVQKHNAASLKAKKALKKKLTEKVEGIGNKVEKLVDCKSHGQNSELFIAEGNSALGSIVLARDATYQAAYPLRGKILNCLKADYTTIFNNQVITDLVKVLGCGIQTDRKNKDLENFDIKKLRFGKIIISTDADPDGNQIACLIITMFYRLMPELIKQGYIYIAQTPLYEVKLKDDTMVYLYSEKEKDEKLSTLQNVKTISRCKGLGELDAETMSETAMNPKTRNLIQVNVEDAKSMIRSLETWMGIDSDSRRKYISENLCNYVDSVDL